ncbi:TPA: phage major capsid protein [Streptococcus pyogenes]|uniref:phage major capsid protein n=1 Tax=Streptococcus pyogenes TaxID=1314 RepID=UPI0003B9CA10|nr:phage major capsid protein [Streptococcus pyogenes]HER4629962.1 phage major capsid protein [Streptococcus pyogenes NGAS599]ESA58731.1 phage major capsid protein, HK97 family [Streptococcus pyogenes GA03805]VGQ20716.1 phage major capsid protein [Streptococcus pyogenes]VGV49261.1 phage major capsid protein [Streptococcus pyogenes]VGV69575.1 phage major capsid protein [Streptococcus pyogenes]
MFEEKIKEIKATIADLNQTIATKTAEVKNALESDDLETARSIKAEIEEAKANLVEAENDLKLYEASIEKGGAENTGGKEVPQETKTYRESVNEFIRSKGKVVNEDLRFEGKDEVLISMNKVTPVAPETDGVKKTDVKPVSSEEILYTPAREVKTVVDLKQFTSIHPAKKASGKWPVLQRATDKMVSVEELEKNPKLAKPQFKEVKWEVKTYRGAIPLSQESIDDADVDLVGIVAETIGQMKVNTTNGAIAEVLKEFESKEVKDLDEIKKLLNVDLDPAYNVSFIVSQSFYQTMDTLKDKNGRYLLQDSITSVSGKVFLGKPVFVLADEVLGENKAFVGDFKRGVLFADRKDLGLRWADNEIYGQYLQAVLRFGVSKVDDKAGYYVTFTPSESL